MKKASLALAVLAWSFLVSVGAFCGRLRQRNNMKTIRRLVLATAFLLGFTGIVAARGVRIWPYQELLEKSDLVVLATPTATNDTQEHIDLPGFVGEHVIGVETRFSVSAVLKGDKALRDFVFHHYRTTDGSNIPTFPTARLLSPSTRWRTRQCGPGHLCFSSSGKLMVATRPWWVRRTPEEGSANSEESTDRKQVTGPWSSSRPSSISSLPSRAV